MNGVFCINVDFEIYNEIIRLLRMKISKVVKFKYIYVYIWNKIDILVSLKKKMKKKNGVVFLEVWVSLCI